MAAPSATARGTPSGIKLEDGMFSKVTFAGNPTISLWEKTAKPPGCDGGDAIDQTTMHNATYRTAASRALITLTGASFKAAYDPNVYTSIISQINSEQVITQRFWDGSTLAYYGFLKSFEPDEMQEGSQPEATVMIVPTNFDPVNKVEAGPTVTSVSGT